MNQNEEMQLIGATFCANEYFEQTPTGMQIRHMIVPDPATRPVMEPFLDAEGQMVLDQEGQPVLRPSVDQDGQTIYEDLPLILGELETLEAYKQRVPTWNS